MMTRTLLLLPLSLVVAIACDSGPKESGKEAPATAEKDAKAEDAEEDEEAEEADAANADDDERIRSWKMVYSGALSGEIGGERIVVAHTGVSSAIQARGPDARLGFSLNKNPRADPPEYSVLPLTATLADGTTCKMSNQPTVKVNAHDEDQVDVAVSGELECGDDDEKVSYELTLVKKG